ncbi:hypothetical protein [Hymenobacter negativus]|nr:hypothetical protein [Hymenobacter negativus]
MKNLNSTAKFKLQKTIVTRFTKQGTTSKFATSTIIETSSVFGM